MPPVRAKRSLLWLHYKEGIDEAICNYCLTKLSTKNGSLGTLKRHLTNKLPTISLNVERQPVSITLQNSEIPTQPSTSATGTQPLAIPSSSGLITNFIRKPPPARKI